MEKQQKLENRLFEYGWSLEGTTTYFKVHKGVAVKLKLFGTHTELVYERISSDKYPVLLDSEELRLIADLNDLYEETLDNERYV